MTTNNKKRHRHVTSKGMGSKGMDYWSYGRQTWPINWKAVSSKQRSCRYCYMDALHGRWLNGWRKSLTAATQECCKQFWTRLGGNTPWSTSCTVTYVPSRKLSGKTNQTYRTLLEKKGRTHKWCSLMDPLKWPSKSRVTSSNLHTAALLGYGM